jgi:hypothetical protein
MCNELDQQVCQVTERSTEGVVDPLPTGVGRNLGRKARQQSSEGLGSVTLQAEEFLELADHPFDDLALAGCPSPIGLRPCPAAVVLRGGSHQNPVALRAVSLPLDPREALVGQVGFVKVLGYERLCYGPLVGGRRGKTESVYHAVQSALLVAASGANAAFFVNHSLVADEVAAAVGATA